MMAYAFNCGFVRVCIINGFDDIHYTCKEKRFEKFQEQFSICEFKVTEKYFHKKSKDLKDLLAKKKFRGEKKNNYVKAFSLTNWNSLPPESKKLHTLQTCEKCISDFTEFQDLIPLKKSRNKETLESVEKTSIEIPRPELKNLGKKVQVQAAASVYRELNETWESFYETPFSEALRKVPEARMTPRKSKVQKQKALRNLHRKCKSGIEKLFQKDNRDVATLFGTRQSGSHHSKHRKGLFFENKTKAIQRTAKRKADLNHDDATEPKKRKQSFDPDNFIFDKQALLDEVRSLPAGYELNLSEFARKYKIPGTNGNVVVKKWLIRNGIDLSKYKTKISKKPRNRRGYEKFPGGSGISIPMPRSYKEIKNEITKGIESGKYMIGDLIEPKTFTKYKIDETGSITTHQYQVCGRKIPLDTIRKRLWEKHTTLGIVRDKHVYQRHLATWGDHSVILGSGYLLFTIRALYSSDLFYDDDEMFNATGFVHDVQELVEEPMIYILGETDDSIAEKLTYSDTRVEDIQGMLPLIIHGKTLEDKLRFFIGDHPELQSESGNSVGGNFPCVCKCPVKEFCNLNCSLSSRNDSLETRRKKVTQGPAGQKQGAVRPFDKLKTCELIKELSAREVNTKDVEVNQKGLERCLKNHMQGIACVPALSFHKEFTPLSDLNLDCYEVSPIEGLHDTKGHIKNIWDVLPEVLSKHGKEKFQEILDTCYGDKSKVKGADYRLSVIMVYQNLKDSVTDDIKELLSTLMEICEFAYKRANQRTPKSILRLFNITFKHALLCTSIFQKTLKISKERMYGIYFHSLTTHLPEVARIIAPSSLHTENEERLFCDLENIAKATSARTKESVRDTGILRLQMEIEWNREHNYESTSKFKSVASKISKFSKKVTDEKLNSTFDLETIPHHLFQIHLERIARYLLCGEGVWWHHKKSTNEIIFHDGDAEAETKEKGPSLLHFTTTTLVQANEIVDNAWQAILSQGIKLPIPSVDIFDKFGNFCRKEKFTWESFDEYLEGEDNTTLQVLPSDDNDKICEVIPIVADTEVNCIDDQEQNMPSIAGDESSDSIQSKSHQAPSSSMNATSITTLKSRTAIAIHKVIGTSSDLSLFDKYHIAYKQSKSQFSSKKCNYLLPKLQGKVKEELIRLTKSIKSWEKNYFQKNLKLPTVKDIEQQNEMKPLYDKITIAKQLLKSWNMSYT